MSLPVISVAEMRRLEHAAVAAGLREADMIQEAGRSVADWLAWEFPDASEFVFFCGKGNNGLDGLVAAQELAARGRRTRCYSPYPAEVAGTQSVDGITIFERPDVVLVDALIGIGAHGELRPELRRITETLLQPGRNPIAAIDVPTGVNADTGDVAEGAVVADVTITCGLPKRGLFGERALDHVGRLRVAPLTFCPPSAVAEDTDLEFFDHDAAARLLPPRRPTAHKGAHGHLYVFAGNLGTAGAAVMAIEGALAAGTGLVTAFVPRIVYGLVASRIPEAMIRPFSRLEDALDDLPPDAPVVFGPGLGVSPEAGNALSRLMRNSHHPLVIDADGLSLFAARHTLWSALRDNILLTPHPGEMRRMTGRPVTSRLDAARDFIRSHPGALALKGCRTIVAQNGRPLSINSTGNPGMATGGMGDVLAGFCGGLMAQGLGAYDAARLGVFLHGLSADLALSEQSVETLLPRHVLAGMGRAFKTLRSA